jgi:hypothetical protein
MTGRKKGTHTNVGPQQNVRTLRRPALTWRKRSSYFQCGLNVIYQPIFVYLHSIMVCPHGGGVVSKRLHDQGTLFRV